MAGSRVFYAVTCKKHGREIVKGVDYEVRVSRPKHFKSCKGCPHCNNEAKSN